MLFDKIDDIKTKEESFFSKFKVVSLWPDSRLGPFAKTLAEKIKKQILKNIKSIKGGFIA